MTKKSLARQQRDAFQEKVKAEGIKGAYDVLNEMHAHQMGLFTQYGKLIELIAHSEIEPHLPNPQRTEILVKGLNAEMGDLLDKTSMLYSLHKGKQGHIKPDDEDEYFQTMQWQQDYIVYLGVHQQNLLPVMFELDEHLKGAIDAKQNLQAQAIATAQALNNQNPDLAPVETPAVTNAYAALDAEAE